MAMASISKSPPLVHLLHINPISPHSCPVILSFPSYRTTSLHPRLCALKTGSGGGKFRGQGAYGSDFLRKPMISPTVDAGDKIAKDLDKTSDDEKGKRSYKQRDEEGWLDWEDQILEDTVPLVGFVRMILHSGKYESGDRLIPEHENTIIERLLRYHPECEKKIGCGIDYITIGFHPEFESSRCLFIVRKDGELVDFSYWKCIKGLIRKNYPLYADSFILRHFRRRRRNE